MGCEGREAEGGGQEYGEGGGEVTRALGDDAGEVED